MSAKSIQKNDIVNSVLNYFKENLGIILALVALCIFLSVNPTTSDSFLTQRNIFNVLRQISTNLYLACGMTMVIILGGIDLSVGSIIALSGCISAGMTARYGLPIPVAIISGCLIGLFIGMCNGAVIAKTTIPPFIVTLAALNIAKVFAYIILVVHRFVLFQKNAIFRCRVYWACSDCCCFISDYTCYNNVNYE